MEWEAVSKVLGTTTTEPTTHDPATQLRTSQPGVVHPVMVLRNVLALVRLEHDARTNLMYLGQMART